MALSKENPADLNQLENFIASAEERKPEKVAQIESLIQLLIDLQILKGSQKKKQEVIAPNRDYINDNESISQQFVAGDRDLEETAPRNSNGLESLLEKMLLLEEKAEDSSSKDIDIATSRKEEKAEDNISKDIDIAPSRKEEKAEDSSSKDIDIAPSRKEKQPEDSSIKDIDIAPSRKEKQPEDSSIKDIDIATSLDKLENANGKFQPIRETETEGFSEKTNIAANNLDNANEKPQEQAEAVLLALLAALNIKVSENSQEKSAEVSDPSLEVYPADGNDRSSEISDLDLTDLQTDGNTQIKEIIPDLVSLVEKGNEESKEFVPELVNFSGDPQAEITEIIFTDRESLKDTDRNLGEDAKLPTKLERSPSELATTSKPTAENEENIEELYDAYKRLQTALMGPDLEDLQAIIAGFEQKVITIEHQIYDPNELVNLLLPVISEILNRKVSESTESRESVAEAMVPIIDEVIQLKSQENREAMGKALASALPVAITEEVRTHPEEFAQAIAPNIALAIDKQINLDRAAMVKALYPIIHQVINSKREEDIDAISAAIAPLLPPAISEQIRNSPQEIAQAIGPEMAAAIREQIKFDREAMIEALAPEMGKAIKAQIEIERDAMVDALYPVIGSTIAKYMADVVRSINEKIENALSLEGFNRKLRAKMQGVSEGELIIKEAVPFAVRAVFLIHKQSGLVISEAQTNGEQRLEADMVAGMLTAIRSFVNDCIAQSGDVSEIDAIDYGNSKIMLEVAGYCYLAIVTQGETPQWFVYRMQQTLQTIVEIAGNPIEHYEGDPAVIPEKVSEILESLANLKRREEKQTTPIGLLLVGSLAAGLILLPLGYLYQRYNVERQIERSTAQALASAPELAVYNLGVKADSDRLQLSGKLPNQYLRQRAAQIAQKIAPDRKLSNQIIAVEIPPDPVLTASEIKRVTAALNQIQGVAITSSYAAGKVNIQGTVAQASDGGKITQAFKQIPGVKALTNTVQLQQASLPVRIYFDAGKTELKAENKDKILEVKAFLLRYPETTLTIIGHSDTKGNSNKNQRLALLRAETVRQALITEGINAKRLQAVATPNPPLGLDSSKPLWLSRCVRFQPVNPGFPRK